MKKHMMMLTATAFVTAGILTACNSPQTKNGEVPMSNTDTAVQPMASTPDTAQTAKEDWQKFKADANERIKQTGDSIEAFKKKINRADKKAAAKLDKRVDELERRNDELKEKLNNFKEDQKADWQKFKADFNDKMDTVAQRWKDLTNKDKSSM